MRRVHLFAVLLSAIPFTAATGQDFEPGDSVVLIERDLEIPAHPGPGDSSIPFRFAGGSVAVILSVDSTTGWFEIRGEQVGGTEATGWIVRRYIDGLASDAPPVGGDDLELAWCPDKSSPTPRSSSRLRIATWNLRNLHAVDGQSTFTGPDPSVKRFAIDYTRIRCYVRLFDPDILAVQEVDGEEALQRIVDTDVYDVHVSSRPKPGFMGGRQNTGFAYKKGLTVQEVPDFADLDTSSGSLRHGARIDVTVAGQTFMLMSVHLKSGCFSNSNSGSSCTKLFSQVPILEEWIDDAAAGTNPFIVLGDFNRRFNQAGDTVWVSLDDSDPPNSDLLAVTENMPISCRDNEFTSFIDHIVLDKRAGELVDRSSFRHVTYRQDDKPVWDKISDHCPVVVELWMQ